MNIIHGEGTTDLSVSIKEKLDCIDKILKSGDINHILAIVTIIDSIRDQIHESLHYIPSPVARRAESVYLKVMSLIQESSGEMEGTFLRVGDDIELLESAGGIIVFKGDTTHIVTCDDNEKLFIRLIIQHGNGLPINEKSLTHVKKISISLNKKLNTFGVFFGIENEKLFCSDKEFSEQEAVQIKNQKIVDKQVLTESTEKIIHSNILYFGEKRNKSIKIQIFTPVRQGIRRDIKVMVGERERIFKPFSFQLFLELLSGTKTFTATQAANIAVFNLLKNTQIDLIGGIKSGLRLAWRTQSLDSLDYYSGSKEIIPNYGDIEDTYISKLRQVRKESCDNQEKTLEEYEKISGEISGIPFHIMNAQGRGRLRKYEMMIGENIVTMSGKQRELFIKLYNSERETLLIVGTEYQAYMQLKKIIPEEYIVFFESKRKDLRKKGNSTRKKNILERRIIPGDEEYFTLSEGEVSIEIIAQGDRNSKITLINNERVILTRGEYILLKKLYESKGKPTKLDVSNITIQKLREKFPDGFIKNMRGKGHYIGDLKEEISSPKTLQKSPKKKNPVRRLTVVQTRSATPKASPRQDMYPTQGEARIVHKIPQVQRKPTELPPEKKYASKQDIKLPEVESETERKILELLSENEGMFFSYESLAQRFGVEDNNDLKMTFLLVKSEFNKLNGERIFERKGKGWFLLPDLQSIPDKKEIQFEGVYGTDTCIFSDMYGVFMTDSGQVIFQNAEIETYITLKNGKLFPKSGRNLNKNIDTLRIKFRNFYPGIKVSAKNIGYSQSTHLQ